MNILSVPIPNSCTPGTLATFEQYAVFCANAGGQSEPVGSKLANPRNLKDIHGNVYEWCWDWFANNPSSAKTDYTGPTTGTYRMIRGGCWPVNASDCRSALRAVMEPFSRPRWNGFRLVRTVD